MKSNYDYFVEVATLKPPIGKYRFAAKVPYIVKNPGENFKRIYPTVNDNWGKEVWGITETEAEKQARIEADKWIAAQQK